MDSPEKQAYGVYAYRMGLFVPWEHLSDTEQKAWREVVELLGLEFPEPELDDLVCGGCGQDLVCPVCEIEKFAVVAATTGKPTAELVQKV